MSFEALRWARDQQVGSVCQKAVLLVLADMANKDHNHMAWPSLATLARVCAAGQSSVRKAIGELVARGLIERLGSTIRRKYRLRLEVVPPGHAVDCVAGERNSVAGERNSASPHQRSGKYPVNYPAGADAKRIQESAKQAAGPSDEEKLWQRRLEALARSGFWHPNWGERPGSPHCRAPSTVLARFGHGAAAQAS
jgi:hypothetical protein